MIGLTGVVNVPAADVIVSKPPKTFDKHMVMLHFIANFFAGCFLCNAIPHLASGLRGEPFPTPFAKPPGAGLSSPVVNTIWGLGNLVVGIVLLGVSPVGSVWSIQMLLVVAGFILLSIPTSIHFGKVRQNRNGQS